GASVLKPPDHNRYLPNDLLILNRVKEVI
ncbi:hypothetical protein CP061683_0874B, partial [Chlamydia psittaci 06-1683]